MPDMDPCQGHPCDQCVKCRSGRCCRRDNPHYQLPQLGEWDGPIHGALGVLADDGVLAQCHACGDYFGHLGAHVSQAHDLTAPEYKAIFGLNAGTGLIGPKLAATRYEAAMARRDKGWMFESFQPGYLATLTPEQRSELASRPRRLERRLRPPDPEVIRKQVETRLRKYQSGELQPNGWADGVDPKEIARLGREALAKKRAEDPEFVARWKAKLSAGQSARQRALGRAPYVKEKACTVCGKVFPVDSNTQSRTRCSRECSSEARRRKMMEINISRRPNVREKISNAAHKRELVRDERGRIITWRHKDG